MNQDYKQLLSQVIKKQIVILGPDITLAKARNVPGLVVADDGTVTDISGDQQQITQKLIDQFVQLSGEIVKKTMEPLLTINQAPAAPAPATPVITPAITVAAPEPQTITPQQPIPVPMQPLTPSPIVPNTSQAQAAIDATLQTSQMPAANPATSTQTPLAQDTKPVQ